MQVLNNQLIGTRNAIRPRLQHLVLTKDGSLVPMLHLPSQRPWQPQASLLEFPQEASPSPVKGRLDQDEPSSDPRLGTSRDDCKCPSCKGHKQWWFGVIGQWRKETESLKTRSGRSVPVTYEECSDNSPVEYAERDLYEGLIEGIDLPRRTL